MTEPVKQQIETDTGADLRKSQRHSSARRDKQQCGIYFRRTPHLVDLRWAGQAVCQESVVMADRLADTVEHRVVAWVNVIGRIDNRRAVVLSGQDKFVQR